VKKSPCVLKKTKKSFLQNKIRRLRILSPSPTDLNLHRANLQMNRSLKENLRLYLKRLSPPANLPSKPQGWEAIPKPKGHSGLDYSKWDKVEDDSSDEDEDDGEEELPQYKFKLRTVGVRSVK
jgi:hypothetical protein